jgi:CelD/BcsL family acetyltransferase involved in cellulose biosynthesis
MSRESLKPLSELKPTDLESWAALAERSAEPNPFYEPEFVLAGAGRWAPALLAIDDGEGPLLRLPTAPNRRRRGLPALTGWRSLYTYLGTPLVRRGAEAAAAEALLEAPHAVGRRSLLILERSGADGAFSAALAEARGRMDQRLELRRERACLRRRPGADHLAGMRPHHRRDHERQGRRLAEQLGGELETRDRAGDDAAVERFLDLEAAGWKGRSATAMKTRGDGDFFRQVCARFAAAGRLELLELGAGERVVAMKCNLRAGDGLFAFKIAFDDSLAKFSPGIQLELENMRRFDRGDAAWFDSCAEPDNQMINRLWPDRRRLQTLVYCDRGVRGRVAGFAVKLAAGLRAAN